MKEDQWRKVQSLFNQICESPPEEWESELARLCDSPELREEVRSLLRYHDEADSFLEKPSVEDVAKVFRQKSHELFDSEPDSIGPYKIVKLLGRGGMGSVYVARQEEPVRREVALKIINLGLDPNQFFKRFRYEHQALALMKHGNIAHVYDAGATDDGRPYFTMEYIDGVNIAEYCDENRLGLRERLKLFQQVCEGVMHAHRKGIIHRDLKPSNILVTFEDQKPVPKIIDFGIAKLLDPGVDGEKATVVGTILGTPAYMSPEQADGRDVDTGADVYSLGMILYELLAGKLPFDAKEFQRTSINKVLQVILEGEPDRPSDRLLSLGEEGDQIAQRRQTVARTLAKEIRVDLDWIVLRAIEKDRSRRYASVDAFAKDIQRYLKFEPVEACPPNTMYRVRKFVRRHKMRVVAGLAVAAALVGTIAGLGYGLWLERQAYKRLDNASTQLEGFSLILGGLFQSWDPRQDKSEEEFLRYLDRIAKSIENLKSAPRFESTARLTIGQAFMGKHLYNRALVQFQLAYELISQDMDGHEIEEALALCHVGDALRRLERWEEAEAALTKALSMQVELLPEPHVDTIETIRRLADTYLAQNQLDKAKELYDNAIAQQEALFFTQNADGPNIEQDKGMLQNLLIIKNNIGVALLESGKIDEAFVLFQETYQRRTELLDENHPELLTSLHNMGWVLMRKRKYAEAEKFIKPAYERRLARFGYRRPTIESAGNYLGLLIRKGTEEANAGALELAKALLPEVKGSTSQELKLMNNMSEALSRGDQIAEALSVKETELAAYERGVGSKADQLWSTLTYAEILAKGSQVSKARAQIDFIFKEIAANPKLDPRGSIKRYSKTLLQGFEEKAKGPSPDVDSR